MVSREPIFDPARRAARGDRCREVETLAVLEELEDVREQWLGLAAASMALSYLLPELVHVEPRSGQRGEVFFRIEAAVGAQGVLSIVEGQLVFAGHELRSSFFEDRRLGVED